MFRVESLCIGVIRDAGRSLRVVIRITSESLVPPKIFGCYRGTSRLIGGRCPINDRQDIRLRAVTLAVPDRIFRAERQACMMATESTLLLKLLHAPEGSSHCHPTNAKLISRYQMQSMYETRPLLPSQATLWSLRKRIPQTSWPSPCCTAQDGINHMELHRPSSPKAADITIINHYFACSAPQRR